MYFYNRKQLFSILKYYTGKRTTLLCYESLLCYYSRSNVQSGFLNGNVKSIFAKHYLTNNSLLLLPCQAFVLSRGSGSAEDLIHIILLGFIKLSTTKDNDGGQNLIGYINKRTDARDPRYIIWSIAFRFGI